MCHCHKITVIHFQYLAKTYEEILPYLEANKCYKQEEPSTLEELPQQTKHEKIDL